jgi:hypothetical protein
MVPPDKMASVVAFTIVKVGNAESASAVNPVICGVVAKLKSKLVIVPVSMKKTGEMKSHVLSAEQSAPGVLGFIVKVTEPGQSVDPVPPFTPRPGSGMPFASPAEDDSPRMLRISKQRKIFTSAPPAHLYFRKTTFFVGNQIAKPRLIPRKQSLCLPWFIRTD